MMAAHVAMNTHRVGSFVLLAGGVVLVFAGLTSALGMSWSGIVASAAAIAALLYAGGVWFGGRGADASVLLFTPRLTVAAGPLAGRTLVDLFPAGSRSQIESHCRAALSGQSQRFVCGDAQAFEAAPVRSADGTVLYGILISGAVRSEQALAG